MHAVIERTVIPVHDTTRALMENKMCLRYNVKLGADTIGYPSSHVSRFMLKHNLDRLTVNLINGKKQRYILTNKDGSIRCWR